MQQEEPQMTPAVAPSAQVRRSRTTIRRQCRRHLADAKFGEPGTNDHLARKLHSWCGQIQRLNGGTLEATQAAMEVSDWQCEKEPPEKTQDRITEIFV